jgi:hypothetical protein
MNRNWSYLKDYLPPVLLLFGVSIFYIYTLAPSLNWADGARMQLDVMFEGSTYWSFDEARQVSTDGLPFDKLGVAAWDHPLYVMIAQLFRRLPVSDPLYRINLMSAFFGVLAIAILYKLGRVLTGDPIAAALGALALAVSHTFWFHSVHPVYYAVVGDEKLEVSGIHRTPRRIRACQPRDDGPYTASGWRIYHSYEFAYQQRSIQLAVLSFPKGQSQNYLEIVS